MGKDTVGATNSSQLGIVELNVREAIREINKSYQTQNRVQSYVVSQNYVVSKTPFFKKALDVLSKTFKSLPQPLRVFEPGMGPAAFSQHLLHSDLLDVLKAVHVEGTDVSDEMLIYATDLLNRLYVENIEGSNVKFNLTAGVNGMNLSDPFYQSLNAQKRKFDVIFASQFEHYFPNSNDSELSQRLTEKEIFYSTKKEFRQYCYDLLDDGGVFFTVDDRLGETSKEHEEVCLAWDTHIVKQFTDENVLKIIENLNGPLVRNLRMTYDASRPADDLVKIAKKTREHRRNICYEEIEPLSKTKLDFIEIFGEGNVEIMMHPSTHTHPGFYMISAFKR